MTSYVHHLPGRLRVKLRSLKRNADYAAVLQTSLSALPGVRDVRINTLTGSLLVGYDPARTDVEALQRAVPAAPVRLAGCPVCGEASAVNDPWSSKIAQTVVDAVVEKAVEQSARTLLRVLF